MNKNRNTGTPQPRREAPCSTVATWEQNVCDSAVRVRIAASISRVRRFDLSLEYLSNFYHRALCWAWEASSLIISRRRGLCFFFGVLFFFFLYPCKCGRRRRKKNLLRHTKSPDSHVVYCRLTKGWEVRTVTSGNMNEVPQRCGGCTGKDSKASRRGRGNETQRGRGITKGKKY